MVSELSIIFIITPPPGMSLCRRYTSYWNAFLLFIVFALFVKFVSVMVYSHWLPPGQGPGRGRMGCMVLCRTFHTTPEQGQGRLDYVPIFQVLKLFQVVCFNGFKVSSSRSRHSQCERYLYNISPKCWSLSWSRRQPV